MLHIIMEYCDSGDLQTMLARKKRPLEEKMVPTAPALVMLE